MCRAEIDLSRLPRRRTISRAVVGSAQVRAALDDAAWRVAGGQRQTRSSGSRANDAATPTKILLNAGIGTLTRDARRMTLALHPPCDDSEALSVRRTAKRAIANPIRFHWRLQKTPICERGFA